MVIHLAGVASVQRCEEKPDEAYFHNVGGLLNVIDQAIAWKVKRFVFASTAWPPFGIYGKTKAIGEFILSDCQSSFQNGTASLRLSNVAGGCHKSTTHLIPSLVAAYKEGKPFELKAHPNCERDFIHIEDVADAFEFFATGHTAHRQAVPDAPSGVFDICTGMKYTIRDVVETFEQITGKKLDIKVTNERAKEPMGYQLDPARAREHGWFANRDLNVIIKDALAVG